MPTAPPPKERKEQPGTATASLFDPDLTKPVAGKLGSSHSGKPSAALAVKPVQQQRPPFRPCNPKEARDSITEVQHGYVGLHSPYNLEHRIQQLERQEAAKRMLGGAYNPNAWSKARKDIEVNYFLNSPDAETKEAERRYIKDKAQRNMVEYYRRMHNAAKPKSP